MSTPAHFALDFEVRDYECDIQGIVNNAVYLNYLEHTRHAYLKSVGLDFAKLHEQGYDLVVSRCEVDYLAPLRSGDCFTVRLSLVRHSRLRFAFLQDTVKAPETRPLLRAKVIGTSIGPGGRPALPPDLEHLLDPAAAQ